MPPRSRTSQLQSNRVLISWTKHAMRRSGCTTRSSILFGARILSAFRRAVLVEANRRLPEIGRICMVLVRRTPSGNGVSMTQSPRSDASTHEPYEFSATNGHLRFPESRRLLKPFEEPLGKALGHLKHLASPTSPTTLRVPSSMAVQWAHALK